MAVSKPMYIGIKNGDCTGIHKSLSNLESELKDYNWIHDEGEQDFQIFELGKKLTFEVVTKLQFAIQEK